MKRLNILLKTNDSVEKILTKFNIKDKDIKNISLKLKLKKTNKYLYW